MILTTEYKFEEDIISWTHWALMMTYGEKDLGQPWFRLWLVAWQHQNNAKKKCWLVIYGVLWNLLQCFCITWCHVEEDCVSQRKIMHGTIYLSYLILLCPWHFTSDTTGNYFTFWHKKIFVSDCYFNSSVSLFSMQAQHIKLINSSRIMTCSKWLKWS